MQMRRTIEKARTTELKPLLQITGNDSSNKGCFGRKTNLFRESEDFAGNRDTWEVFREI